MIPMAQITQWRQISPWSDDMQVEQDLILSRIIVDIFSEPLLKKELAFRGGTALHKLFFNPAARYSEDIDLVRTSTGGIKPIIDALRARLEPWLGKPKTTQNDASFKLLYYFTPETSPATKLRIKIEMNIRENFSILQRLEKDFSVDSEWFSGNATVNTFRFEELIATKLRALYQRKKGRDLFDLWLALQHPDLDYQKVIEVFQSYIRKEGNKISRANFEKNLAEKLNEYSFITDIRQLISPYFLEAFNPNSPQNKKQALTKKWNLLEAAEEVKNKIFTHL